MTNSMTDRELYLLTECMEWKICDHIRCKARREIAELRTALNEARQRLVALGGDPVLDALNGDSRLADEPKGEWVCKACGTTNYESNLYKDGCETCLEPRPSEKSECSPGPIQPEPHDYTVQCRCGWMGKVSTLKSLPEFKRGCPLCSTEFAPIDRITFPVRTTDE